MALPGGAGWVANTTHFDCCYYDRMQECNFECHSANLHANYSIISIIQ